MERTFRHEVTYTNTGSVPVTDVALSLLANEKLMREAIEALQDLYPGLEVTDFKINYRRATSDSPLKEALEAIGSLVFQQDFDKRIPLAVYDLTGIEIPQKYDAIVSLVVIAIATYGIYWAIA